MDRHWVCTQGHPLLEGVQSSQNTAVLAVGLPCQRKWRNSGVLLCAVMGLPLLERESVEPALPKPSFSLMGCYSGAIDGHALGAGRKEYTWDDLITFCPEVNKVLGKLGRREVFI